MLQHNLSVWAPFCILLRLSFNLFAQANNFKLAICGICILVVDVLVVWLWFMLFEWAGQCFCGRFEGFAGERVQHYFS